MVTWSSTFGRGGDGLYDPVKGLMVVVCLCFAFAVVATWPLWAFLFSIAYGILDAIL